VCGGGAAVLLEQQLSAPGNCLRPFSRAAATDLGCMIQSFKCGNQPAFAPSVGAEMTDSFNKDFYVTAATVIPVLYLAVAV
jgi:hypothetical protein